MKEAEDLRKKQERAWLEFEDQGAIETYLLYQQLSEELASLEKRAEPTADKRG